MLQPPTEFSRKLFNSNGTKHTNCFILAGCGLFYDIIIYALNKIITAPAKQQMRAVILFSRCTRALMVEHILLDLLRFTRGGGGGDNSGIDINHVTVTGSCDKNKALEILSNQWQIALVTASKIDELSEIDDDILKSIKLMVFDNTWKLLCAGFLQKHLSKRLKQVCQLSYII